MEPVIQIARLLRLPIAMALFILAAQSAADLTWRTSASLQNGTRAVATGAQDCRPADPAPTASPVCRPG
jgi:hypothetical protein